MSKRAIALVFVLGGVLVGMWLGGHPDKLPDGVRDVFVDQKAEVSDQVLQQIEDNYWKPVSSDDLQNASANGMVNRVRKEFKDRFSHYFDPKQFQQFQQVTEGRFSGVGLGVTGVKRGLRVSEVFKGSPAQRAGIKRGDVIVAVNGKSIAGMDATLATGLIKGDPGTEVTLTVLPGGKPPPRKVTIERANIDVPVVDGRMIKINGTPVGYVRMSAFTPGVHDALRKQIEDLRAKGAKGLILDLRNNGGGLLDEAWLTGSIFVEDGTIVSTDSRTQGKKTYPAAGDAIPPQPMVVLVNRDTASAAEILTAALGENNIATVVGTRTYGKGVFQQVIPLDSGGGLDLTVGEYLTSNGTSIAGKGVQPQVKAPDNPKTPADETLQKARAVLIPEINK
jgi:carboxyl-terminal processing protease